MGEITISLKRWIAVSALHETTSIRQVNGGAEATTKDARLAYVDRAAKVALLIIDSLLRVDAPVRSEDIDVENFTAEIRFDDSTQSGEESNSHDAQAQAEAELKFVSEGILTGIKFSAPVAHRDSGRDPPSDAHFKKIGLVFYTLFCRGETPTSQLESNGAGNSMPTEDSDTELSNKRATKAEKCPNVQLFTGHDLPSSICRLVSDLMRSEATDTLFESLDDIVSELKQFLEMPDVFLQPSDTGLEQLRFEGDVYGRTSELRSLLEMAANAIDGDPLENKLFLLAGNAGSGKSSLVRSIQEPMRELGFMHISAKFDRLAQQQPLSTIASAFDDFFSSLSALRQNEDEVNDAVEDIVASVETELSASGIVVLSNLMPSLRGLFPHILRRVVSDPDLTALGEEQGQASYRPGQVNVVEDDEDDTSASNAEMSRNRLHFLFRKLVNAICSPEHPLFFFFDDLLWADSSSLDLISSLLLEFDHLNHDEEISQRFLVVATYRDNEVDETHLLAPYIQKFDDSNSIQVCKVNLGAMPRESANTMISRALKLPLRLTRTLTDVILSKTLGNPFHMKAFMESLVAEKILHYSLMDKRWVWDIEAVRAVSINETVAELLTRRLLQLPDIVQSAAKIVSCFGSQINGIMLESLLQSEQWSSLANGLDDAVQENILVKQGSHCYNFVHDMLQQTSYELMSEEERCGLHYDMGMQLIATMPSLSEDSEFSPAAFEAIGQINRANIFQSESLFRVQFATLNLKAGRRSIEVSDFGSALSYMECGIAFLPEEGWESTYDLNLELYGNAALASYVLSLVDKMTAFLMEVFEHATCLEDKLKGYYILVRSMACVGSVDEATEKILTVLESLGEDFPDYDDITPDMVRQELVSTQAQLASLTKEDVLNPRRLTDTIKVWAVKYLAIFIVFLVNSRPKYLPLAAARIIKISTSYGYTSDSAFGFIGFGHALLALCQDIDNAYRLGKMAMLLESSSPSFACPRAKFWFGGLIAAWKEPLQSIVELQRANEKVFLSSGDNEYAALCVITICRLGFFSGRTLSSLDKECTVGSSMMKQLQQTNIHATHIMQHRTFLRLMGSNKNPFVDAFGGTIPIKNEDELLLNCRDAPSIHRAVCIQKMFIAFWFKRYDEAGEMAMKFDSSRFYGLLDIMHIFYRAMIAFQLARRRTIDEPQWMEIAEKALSMLRTWVKHSTWNFENRMFLLEAEWHFTKGEIDGAKEKYENAIESARKHRFVHEEGLANELCSDFHLENGDVDRAKPFIAEAQKCYEKWGAHALVKRLDENRIK